MQRDITIKVGDLVLKGELHDTYCAKKIWESLPFESEFDTWGDEIYFPIGLQMTLDDTARKEVEVGTIGYWPAGAAIAIFFGPTPASTGEKPIAASDVNIVGKVKDPTKLREVKEDSTIRVEKL